MTNEERTLAFLDAKVFSLKRELELCQEVRGMLTAVDGAPVQKKRGRPSKDAVQNHVLSSVVPVVGGRGKPMSDDLKRLIVEYAKTMPVVTTGGIARYLMHENIVPATTKYPALSTAVRTALRKAGFKIKGERDKATWYLGRNK